MNMIQRQLGLIPSIVTKENKAEYIQALIDTREQENQTIIQDVMLQQHIQNLENRILQYQGSLSDTVKLSVLQNLLAIIKEHPDYTYEQYATQLGVGRATIARNIKKLVETKHISRTGSDKAGYWTIHSSFCEPDSRVSR